MCGFHQRTGERKCFLRGLQVLRRWVTRSDIAAKNGDYVSGRDVDGSQSGTAIKRNQQLSLYNTCQQRIILVTQIGGIVRCKQHSRHEAEYSYNGSFVVSATSSTTICGYMVRFFVRTGAQNTRTYIDPRGTSITTTRTGSMPTVLAHFEVVGSRHVNCIPPEK